MVQELNFQAYSDRLPPQNIDAEEAILGGILIDPEAIGRVAELLQPDAFYISAHQEIYRTALVLYGQGKPTDLMTVSTALHDRGVLDKVGGQSRIAQLVDRTVSAVNIDQYAQLVVDKYLRRKMIQVGTEISYLAYETTSTLETVLDQAEQRVFSITQSRPNQSLVPTADILTATFSDIEERFAGMVMPGISCGFYDLDALTQGFQRSDLIITAARPAMGKCLVQDAEIVLSDGSIATIEELYQRRDAELLTLGSDWRFALTRPSAFVDDGVKPVFRVMTRLGRTLETTLTHPFLTMDGWQQLGALKPGNRIAVPRQIAIFGTHALRPCEVKLLAYLLGDGCLTRTNPGFTNSNPNIQHDFLEAVSEFGSLRVRVVEDGIRTTSYFVAADSNTAAEKRRRFGWVLRQELQQRGIADRDLAHALDVSQSLVCQWKQGICVPAGDRVQAIANVLQIPLDTLCPEGVDAFGVGNELTAWLRSLNLWGKSAHQKEIPPIVFQLQRSQVALFLNRLFATDGWATVLTSGQAQMGYATVSERLARQVQHLLLRFGIIAALKQRTVTYMNGQRRVWQLDITDAQAIQTFIAEIGIFAKHEAVSQVAAALTSRSYHTNRDIIPPQVGHQLDRARQAESWQSLGRRAGIAGHSNLHVGQRSLSCGRLMSLATALDATELQYLASSEVYWDEIVAIEPAGHRQVYDLTIPETHNFVANDICVHNTSFCLNIARNISAFHKLPVAVFSLEMSKEQLVYRLLSSEAQIESGRLRAGRISQNEWEPLGHAISALSQMPIFIDDTPNISVTEMRSKVRRLQAEQGGALGLVLIDYLQLMEGSGGDNRVQELSKVTRSLKGLARELNVPVMALSQLSRGVEARTNKRPMMSDLRECVTGDTLVWLADGRRVPIADLVGQTPEVVSMNQQGQLIKAKADLVWEVGTKPVFEVRMASGRKIRATGKHRLYTLDGWQRVQDFRVGDRLAVANHMPLFHEPGERWPDSNLILLAHLIGDGSYLPHQPLRYTTASEANSEVVKAAAEEFGCTVNRHPGRGNWHQLVISGNGNRWHPAGVGLWLKELGIFGQRSAEKRVPGEVFQLPIDQIARFLQHLWATDGCISSYYHPNGQKFKASIFFSTVSEGLARDVVALLLRLGIISHMQWTQANCYTVQVYGKTQQLRFLDVVGAFGPRVAPAETAKAELLRRGQANPNRDTLPNQVFERVKQEMKEQGISQRQMAKLRGTSYGGTSHFSFAPTRNVVLSYADILESAALKEIATSDLFWDEVASIEPVGEETVYDLTVPGPASWMADGLVSHNSGSIEQDADLIIMLYRDEYYNPDTPDRGIAEIILTKHRNGPVGTIKVLFEPMFTRFRNLAQPGRG